MINWHRVKILGTFKGVVVYQGLHIGSSRSKCFSSKRTPACLWGLHKLVDGTKAWNARDVPSGRDIGLKRRVSYKGRRLVGPPHSGEDSDSDADIVWGDATPDECEGDGDSTDTWERSKVSKPLEVLTVGELPGNEEVCVADGRLIGMIGIMNEWYGVFLGGGDTASGDAKTVIGAWLIVWCGACVCCGATRLCKWSISLTFVSVLR